MSIGFLVDKDAPIVWRGPMVCLCICPCFSLLCSLRFITYIYFMLLLDIIGVASLVFVSVFFIKFHSNWPSASHS